MCSLAYTQLMVITSEKLTGTDGGHGNYFTLVEGHRLQNVGNHCSTGLSIVSDTY